jgi:hypothetical protein
VAYCAFGFNSERGTMNIFDSSNNPYKSEYWYSETIPSGMISLDVLHAERALREVAEHDAKYWKFQAWKMFFYGVAVCAPIVGTLVYLFTKGN